MSRKIPNAHWQLSVKKMTKRLFNIVELPYVHALMAVLGIVVVTENQSPAYFLAEAMYFETWEEPYFSPSRQAIAAVILNRTKDPRWPNHVEFVVKEAKPGQSCSFSYRCDGYPNNPWLDGQDRWLRWLMIRSEANLYFFAHHYLGVTIDPTAGALYYKRQGQESGWLSLRVAERRVIQVPGSFGTFEFYWDG